MSYIIIFVLGGMFGFFIVAILSANSDHGLGGKEHWEDVYSNRKDNEPEVFDDIFKRDDMTHVDLPKSSNKPASVDYTAFNKELCKHCILREKICHGNPPSDKVCGSYESWE